MTYEDSIGVDFDANPELLFKPEYSCCTMIMDKDVAEQTELKTAAAWRSSKKNYEEHLALLMAHTENRSGMLPPSADHFVFSCVVVWVSRNQSLYDLVYNDADSTGEPSSFSALRLIQTKNGRGEPCVVYNRRFSGCNACPDNFVLIPIQERGAIWTNEMFELTDDDGGSSPAFNPLYFKGSEVIPKQAVMYNPTLGLAAMVAEIAIEGAPPPFLPNDGVDFVPAAGSSAPGDSHQPMELGSQDLTGGNVSDTTASTHPDLGAPVESATTPIPPESGEWDLRGDTSATTHTPATPIATPASQSDGQGQTMPIFRGSGFIPGAILAAAHQLNLNTFRWDWVDMMTAKVHSLIKPTKKLAEKYGELAASRC